MAKSIYDYILSDLRTASGGIPSDLPKIISAIQTIVLDTKEYYDLPQGSGFGTVMFGDDVAHITFTNDDSGNIVDTVVKNVFTTNTAYKYCVFTNNSSIRIQNNTATSVSVQMSYSGLIGSMTVPSGVGTLKGLTQDSLHRTITDAERLEWDNKLDNPGFNLIDASIIGKADGLAELDSNGKIKSSQMTDNMNYSSGFIFPRPILTDNKNGTVSVATGYARMYDNVNMRGVIRDFVIPGITLPVPQGVSYMIAKYYNGIVSYQITTDASDINESDIIPVHTISREGANLDWLDWNNMAEGLPNKLHARQVKTDRFALESGLKVTDGARHIYATEAEVWIGAHKFSLPSFDSSVDEMYKYMYDESARTWTVSQITKLPNVHNPNLPDDGKDHYNICWLYRMVSAHSNKMIVIHDNREFGDLYSTEEIHYPLYKPEIADAMCIEAGRALTLHGSDNTIIQNVLPITYERTLAARAPVDAEKNVQSDFTETDNTEDSYIKNIPLTFPPSTHTHSQYGDVKSDGTVGMSAPLTYNSVVETDTDANVPTIGYIKNNSLTLKSGAFPTVESGTKGSRCVNRTMTSGLDSFGFGQRVLSGSSSYGNIAIGKDAQSYSDSEYAIGIGNGAGRNMVDACSISIGQYANAQRTLGCNSVGLGNRAGFQQSGYNTISIGTCAGSYNRGDCAISIGSGAALNSRLEETTSIGYNAGTLSCGKSSIIIGSQAASCTESILSSTIVGGNAGKNSKKLSLSVGIGDNTLNNHNGHSNIAIGYNSGSCSSGDDNIYIGCSAGFSSVVDDSVMIGCNAGELSTGSVSTGIGTGSMRNNIGCLSSALGAHSLSDNIGECAIGIGYNAGKNNAGSNTIILGADSGVFNGSNNSLIINGSSKEGRSFPLRVLGNGTGQKINIKGIGQEPYNTSLIAKNIGKDGFGLTSGQDVNIRFPDADNIIIDENINTSGVFGDVILQIGDPFKNIAIINPSSDIPKKPEITKSNQMIYGNEDMKEHVFHGNLIINGSHTVDGIQYQPQAVYEAVINNNSQIQAPFPIDPNNRYYVEILKYISGGKSILTNIGIELVMPSNPETTATMNISTPSGYETGTLTFRIGKSEIATAL